MKRLILILTLIGIMTNTYSQSTLMWTKDFTTGLNNYYSEYLSAEYVSTGSYTDSAGKTISVQGFFMTNEVTNKAYREFVDYVVSHPDSSLLYYNRTKAGGFYKQQVPFAQFRHDLIDSLAMAKKYPSGSDLNHKYTNYFTDKTYDDYPVVGVSYDAANYYCIWKTRLENETLKKKGMGLINDLRVPTKQEFEYALSFSKFSATNSEAEIGKSKSGKADKLGLYHLVGNADEWLISFERDKKIITSGSTTTNPVGFRMVSTFLGKN